jgi:hypothetical protein
MPRDQHASLTCRAVGTICRSIVRHDGVFACKTPTYISRQTRTGSCSGTSSLVACTILVANHAEAQSNKRPIPRWSILRRSASLARSRASLLITSRGIQQPSGPSHHTTQSNKPSIPPVVYIYSGLPSSSENSTEIRLGTRASHAAPAASNSHLQHSRHNRTQRFLIHTAGICLRSTDTHQ